MRLLRFSVLIFLLLLSTQVFAQSSLEERGYGIYVPTTHSAESEPMPLVIALHGFGGSWDTFAPFTGLVSVAERYGFIAAFPNGYLNQWNDGSQGEHYEDDVELLLHLIDVIDEEYNVDRERVYLVGFSNGGTMVYKAACDAPGVFAGIASVGGTMRSSQECEEDARTSVMIIHGTGDDVVPLNGSSSNRRHSVFEATSFWANINGCDVEDTPEFDEEDFVDSIATYFYEDCVEGNLVILYLVAGMPHTWPGGSDYINNQTPDPRIDGALLIWGFFEHAYEVQQSTQIEATPEATEAAD